MWWQKLLLYGCMGMVIEVFFTSIASLIQKNWKATGCTYLWMVPIYGLTSLGLEWASDSIHWPFYLKAFVYLPVFFIAEALGGWGIQALTALLQRLFGGSGGGTIPWDYGKSHWTPMGLVNFKYTPFWLALAMGFDPLSAILRRVVNFLATVN